MYPLYRSKQSEIQFPVQKKDRLQHSNMAIKFCVCVDSFKHLLKKQNGCSSQKEALKTKKQYEGRLPQPPVVSLQPGLCPSGQAQSLGAGGLPLALSGCGPRRVHKITEQFQVL